MILYKKKKTIKSILEEKSFKNANGYDGIDENPMLLILLVTGRAQDSRSRENFNVT
jgi:hypothetical protein